MKKLTKDQIQKIALSSLLMIGLIYCYFQFLIFPLNRSDTAARAALADLDTKMGTSGKRLTKLKNIDEQARSSSDVLAQVNAMIPSGEPIAWFPPRMRAFFDRQGIKDAVTRLERKEKLAEPELSDFSACGWNIELPGVDFVPLGIALAGLENEEPLLEITRLQVSTTLDNPEAQRVSMSVNTILH
jgi:hypothetical protein